MQGKIALEEHFTTEEYLEAVKPWFINDGPGVWEKAKARMSDITGQRLQLMDEAGIEKTILSLTSPTIQGILDVNEAVSAAKRANDYICEQIHGYKDRFEALAALPPRIRRPRPKNCTGVWRSTGFGGR